MEIAFLAMFADELARSVQYLRDSLREDRNMLHYGTQQTAASFLASLGKVLIYGGPLDWGQLGFPAQTIVDALRHAGNNVLGQVGDDQRRQLDGWDLDMRSEFSRDAAEDMACGLIDELEAHRAVVAAGQAYLDGLDEDDQWRESLARELENFRTIAKVYEDGVKSHPNGIRALTWAYRSTNFVKNQRALLPEGAEVPWYLDPTWYENYGMAMETG